MCRRMSARLLIVSPRSGATHLYGGDTAKCRLRKRAGLMGERRHWPYGLHHGRRGVFCAMRKQWNNVHCVFAGQLDQRVCIGRSHGIIPRPFRRQGKRRDLQCSAVHEYRSGGYGCEYDDLRGCADHGRGNGINIGSGSFQCARPDHDVGRFDLWISS